jgi:hypothetical protein
MNGTDFLKDYEVHKLSLTEKDVIILSVDAFLSDYQIDKLRKDVEKVFRERCEIPYPVVVFQRGVSVSTLSVEESTY